MCTEQACYRKGETMKAYQYKITLKDSHPPIWRRIVIPACMSFETFSRILQKLFGFDGDHLSEFWFRDRNLSLHQGYDPESRRSPQLMDRHPLEEFETVRKYTYIYDFGDHWEFEILREKILKDYPDNYPILLKYKGDNLVEDCGGVYRYDQLLEAWENPAEADPELLEWAGPKENYDFNPESAEKILKGYTCDENGTFLLPEGLEEADDYDETEEELALQEIRKALKEETLKLSGEEDPEGTANLLLNMLRNPDDMDQLLNLERLPKNLQELRLTVSCAVMDAFAHAALSVSREFEIPSAKIVESFHLDPQETETIRAMVQEAEEDDIPY